MSKQSEALGQVIVTKLVAAKLLSGEEGAKLSSAIGAGTVRPEDWRLSLEKSALREVTE